MYDECSDIILNNRFNIKPPMQTINKIYKFRHCDWNYDENTHNIDC